MAVFVVVDHNGAPLAKIKAENRDLAESHALRSIVGAHHVLETKSSMRGDVEKRLVEQFEAQGLSPSYARIEASRTNLDMLRTNEVVGDSNLSADEKRMAEAFRSLGMTEEKVKVAVKGRKLG